MPEQLSLLEFGGNPSPTDRLLFAIYPPAETGIHIAQLRQSLTREWGLRGKPIERNRSHVTLLHLGDYEGLPRGIVAAASEAAAAAAIVEPPFYIAFDRVMSFSGKPGNLPYVLCGGDGIVALTAFQRILSVAMASAGLKLRHGSKFTPHLTLLFDKYQIPEQAIETVGWTVQEFVLVHSLLGRSIHIPLARWPLRG